MVVPINLTPDIRKSFDVFYIPHQGSMKISDCGANSIKSSKMLMGALEEKFLLFLLDYKVQV